MAPAYLDSKTGHQSIAGRSHFHFNSKKNELQGPLELQNMSIVAVLKRASTEKMNSRMVRTVIQRVDIQLYGFLTCHRRKRHTAELTKTQVNRLGAGGAVG